MSIINLLLVVWGYVDQGLTDATEIARKLALIGPPNSQSRKQVYARSLKRAALTTVLFPIPILILGIIGRVDWLVATAGILWVISALILTLVAIPIGIVIEILYGGFRGIGKRYVNLCLWIYLIEICFTGYVTFVPIHNDPLSIPGLIIVIMALVITGILGRRGIPFQKIVATIATIMLIWITFSLFLPNTSGAIKTSFGHLDTGTAKLLDYGSTKVATAVESLTSGKETLPEGYYPPCASSPDFYFSAGDHEQFIEADIHPECWSGWITTPIGTRYSFQSTANLGLEVEFRDGYREYLEPSSNAMFGKRRGIFRLRGEGTVIVTFDYPDEEY